LTATVLDAQGQPVANQLVTFTANGTRNTLSPPSSVTNAMGVARATLASTHAETKTVIATVGTKYLQTQVVFTLAATRVRSALVVTPSWVGAGMQATITVVCRDGDGSPVPGQPVSLSVSGSANSINPMSGTADLNGKMSATFSSTQSELKTVTANFGAFTLTASLLVAPACTTTPRLPAPPWLVAPTTVFALGDFDRDGNVDIVFSDANGLSVARGHGDGWFAPTVVADSAAQATSLVVGDWNEDGWPDLAGGYGPLHVYQNTGGGSFFGLATYSNLSVQALVTADFNGDKHADIAVVNSASAGTVTVLPGVGDGTFGMPQSYAVGMSPLSITASDLDHDGRMDLIVSNYGDSSLTILLNKAAGMQTSTIFPPGANMIRGAVAADVNADGHVDLTVGEVTLLGKGDGTFQPARGLLPQYSLALAAADTNGDGAADVLVSPNGIAGVQVFLGNTTGGMFAPGPVFVSGFQASVGAMADVNGDGWQDVLVAEYGAPTIAIALGTAGGFREPVTYADGEPSVGVGDLNGDGKLDLVTTLDVRLGNGDGTFGSPIAITAVQDVVLSEALADVDLDGTLDLVIGSTYALYVAHGNGDGTFQSGKMIGLGRFGATAVADLNADGNPDLLAVNNNQAGTVSVFLGEGFTWASGVSYPTGGQPVALAVADLNNDGVSDVVIANQGSNNVAVLLGNIDGTLMNPATSVLSSAPQSIAVADLNGDGNMDVIAANPSYGLYVLLGTGNNGKLQTPVGSPLRSAFGVTAGDINGDGRLDVIASDADSAAWLFLGGGDGTLAPPMPYGAGLQPTSLVAADLNGDGRPDIAAISASGWQIMLDTGCSKP
jgi:hypothetical protein